MVMKIMSNDIIRLVFAKHIEEAKIKGYLNNKYLTDQIQQEDFFIYKKSADLNDDKAVKLYRKMISYAGVKKKYFENLNKGEQSLPKHTIRRIRYTDDLDESEEERIQLRTKVRNFLGMG